MKSSAVSQLTDSLPRFPLIRHFIFWTIATTLACTSILILSFIVDIREDLLSKETEYTELVALQIDRQVKEHFGPYLEETEKTFDMEDKDQRALLQEIVAKNIEGLDIRQVYFFDAEGSITFSTRSDHIGARVTGNDHLTRAQGGETSAVMLNRGAPSDTLSDESDEPLLETYVPIWSTSEPRQVISVIETYKGASDYLANVRRSQLRSGITALIGMLALFIANFFIVRRGARQIQLERNRANELVDRLALSNQELTQLSDSLEVKVEEATRKLLRSERLAALGTLSAGMAHEINTPLASIATCGESILRHNPDLPRTITGYLDVINKEAYRCKTITRNLLDFAGGDRAMVSRPFDLKARIHTIEDLLAFELEDRGLRLYCHLPKGDVRCNGSADEIEQVLLNTIRNAMDASTTGSEIHINVTLNRDTDCWETTITDNGSGLTRDALQQAFEPFFTTKEPGQGTGLGLSVSYGIISRHGGCMTLTSDNGETQASFTLPRFE